MKSLPQVVMDKEQENIIYKKIDEYFQDVLFAFIDKVLNLKRVDNDGDLIANAVKAGKIEYIDGVFRAKGNLSNKLSKEFERIGGRYSRASGGYRLPIKSVPINIQQAIAQVRMANQDKIARIQTYLGDLQANMEYVGNNIDFGQQVEKIGENLDRQFKRSMAKVNVIPAELTSYQLSEIAKNYTYNLNYYINKWTQKEIITMREDLQKMTLAGYRAESLEDYFTKRKGIGRRKAKFLARQETKLLVAEYRKNRFKQEGVTKYRWSTILDGRERKLHKELNGRIFSWDNPPIIDERTGERGSPGEAYNCYSKDTEVLTRDGFKLIKDVRIGEDVATLNPQTKQFEWSVCSNKVCKKVASIANIKNNIFDLSVSLDHTFFYYKKSENGNVYPVFTKGIDTLARKNTRFYASSKNWSGINVDCVYNIPVDVFCKFMGYYLSDGCVDKRSTKCICISQQNNDWMYNELKDYLHVCKGKDKLYIYNEDLYGLVSPLGLCNEKRIPYIIKMLPSEKIRIFLDAFACCDGRKSKEATGFCDKKVTLYNQYFTTSKKMMSDLVECIYKTEKSASVYTIKSKGKKQKFKNGIYTINFDVYIVNEMKTVNRNLVKAEISIDGYNDYVYDIEVAKNHTILIKKGKSIHWNSNCRCKAIPVVDDDWWAES